MVTGWLLAFTNMDSPPPAPHKVHPLSWASKLGIQAPIFSVGKKRIVQNTFFYIGNFKDHHYAVRKECTEKFVGIF